MCNYQVLYGRLARPELGDRLTALMLLIKIVLINKVGFDPDTRPTIAMSRSVVKGQVAGSR